MSILGVASLSSHAATLVGGDYAGADLVPADGDVLDGTFTNVGTFHVPAGTEVDVKDGVALVVEADTILIEGFLDGKGAGFDGGGANQFEIGQPGEGPGAGLGDSPRAPSGAGYGGLGGRGGKVNECLIQGAAGGPTYGTHGDPFDAPLGSGGGGSGCGEVGADDTYGGDGGGSVTLRAGEITISAGGKISVAGGRGQDFESSIVGCDDDFYGGSGSGGGSGGTIVLDATSSVEILGSLTAIGGAGGEPRSAYVTEGGGGGGGGGRIKIYGPVVGTPPDPRVKGGAGGPADPDDDDCGEAQPGERGTVYVDDLVAGPPSLTASGSCGSVTSTVTGATPFGKLQLITGTDLGADTLPAGAICGGLATGMDDVTNHGLRTIDATGFREWTTGALPCGVPYQVVDLWSCTTSPVVNLP